MSDSNRRHLRDCCNAVVERNAAVVANAGAETVAAGVDVAEPDFGAGYFPGEAARTVADVQREKYSPGAIHLNYCVDYFQRDSYKPADLHLRCLADYFQKGLHSPACLHLNYSLVWFRIQGCKRAVFGFSPLLMWNLPPHFLPHLYLFPGGFPHLFVSHCKRVVFQNCLFLLRFRSLRHCSGWKGLYLLFLFYRSKQL